MKDVREYIDFHLKLMEEAARNSFEPEIVPVTIRIPVELRARLDAVADALDTSRNGVVTDFLEMAVRDALQILDSHVKLDGKTPSELAQDYLSGKVKSRPERCLEIAVQEYGVSPEEVVV